MHYLMYAPADVDIKQLVKWISAHSGGYLTLEINNKITATWSLEDEL